MLRYHFDLVDHMTVEDKGGQVLSDDVTASDVADRLAEDVYMVRPELHGKGFSIVVTGPDGDTVHKAPIVAKIGQRSHSASAEETPLNQAGFFDGDAPSTPGKR
jgi:hypothetical protein